MKIKGESKRSGNITAVIFAVMIIASFLSAVKFLSQIVTEHYDNEIIVCLDAGHGGSDSGATSTDGERKEKDDNLRLATAVKAELEKEGIKVVMTREDDSHVSLKERCKKANKNRCDLFVAIHRNSSATGKGLEAWISKNEKNGEKKLAKNILNSICTVTGQDNRGVKLGYRDTSAENYYINSNTNMPSMLLEIGFITDETDNEIFDKMLNETATAISKEICSSLK